MRELVSQYRRTLFAVHPPETQPIYYPVSQFASRLLADRIVSSDTSSAMEAVDDLLNLIDTRDAGTFELRRPDWQCHCELALEDFALRAQDAAYKEQQLRTIIYIFLSPHHARVHPGIDAIVFDARNPTFKWRTNPRA
ncbi:hypothetical protein AZE42_07510 [Rhizopogon vesiculosus]|uniref:Uncharacterized protein n=1 Tax=Rhizopogon vesiculosus TaxID=180088 RepID=A0A1J8QQB6_9AGAM|nr:hypothetical protein AZE42_07510 [Rhizopogon vesiculosus]